MTQAHNPHQELLFYAARLVVEEGADYHHAKQQAARYLRLPSHTTLPDNNDLEDAVIQHIQLFYAETQPLELQKLRQVALKWMRKMKDFTPYLSGAVWHGSATRHSDIYIQIFCNDPKAAEIHLINQHTSYTAAEMRGIHKKMVYTFCIAESIPEWQQQILIYISVYDADDMRGALKFDTKGRSPRGNIHAVQSLLSSQDTPQQTAP